MKGAATRPVVVAVLTSHNRKDITLRCLQAVRVAAEQAEVDLSAVLVDDGSCDGTAQAIAQRFAWVTVDRSDGSLFWSRGMHRAMALAMKQRHDYLLWLNDDTELLPDALTRLLAAAGGHAGRPTIVVGATADRDSGCLTYSGVIAPNRWRPFAFRPVFSPERALPCDTMNGNCVLIPAAVAARVGNLDPAFEHSMGDIDYGLRARRLGIAVVVAQGIAGLCSRNPLRGSFMDRGLPLHHRWRVFTSRKVLPLTSWQHLTRRHGGLLWPLHFAWPYLVFVVKAAFPARARVTDSRDAVHQQPSKFR